MIGQLVKKSISTMSKTNPKFIDSHLHIHRILSDKRVNLKITDFPEYEKNEILKISSELNCDLEAYVNVVCDPKYFESSTVDLLKTKNIFGTFGIHPHCAKEYNEKLENFIIQQMSSEKVVAWGECGLDFFYNNSEKDDQISCFKRQLQMAVKCKKPVVIHSRDAFEETFEIMSNELPNDWKIHFHCFTYEGEVGISIIKKLMNQFPNLYFGFTGAITFKKSDKLRESVASVPLERILLETDAPYMAPGKYRGQVCHSGMIPLIGKTISEVKNISFEEVMEQTYQNSKFVYGIE
jgi:TatD DNase family protein